MALNAGLDRVTLAREHAERSAGDGPRPPLGLGEQLGLDGMPEPHRATNRERTTDAAHESCIALQSQLELLRADAGITSREWHSVLNQLADARRYLEQSLFWAGQAYVDAVTREGERERLYLESLRD